MPSYLRPVIAATMAFARSYHRVSRQKKLVRGEALTIAAIESGAWYRVRSCITEGEGYAVMEKGFAISSPFGGYYPQPRLYCLISEDGAVQPWLIAQCVNKFVRFERDEKGNLRVTERDQP